MPIRKLIAAVPLLVASTALAQTPAPVLETLPNGLGRLVGTEPLTHTAYTRILLSTRPTGPFDPTLPTLTGRCALEPDGRRTFDLFLTFGDVTDTAFYPRWHATPGNNHRPDTTRVQITMAFLGYTRVKPIKRQFEFIVRPLHPPLGGHQVLEPTGLLRYTNPGLASGDMEEITYDFQYLRALPTLRVTDGTHTAEFLTTAFLTQLHSESNCANLGL